MQSRVGNNLWQVDPGFRVQFFIFYQSSFCMFHWGCLSLNLVWNFYMKFCKKNYSLVNWNEINDWFMSHLSWLSTWCVYFCLYISFSNCYIQKIILKWIFQQAFNCEKTILSTCNQYLWVRILFLMAIKIGLYSRLFCFSQEESKNAWVRSFNIFSSISGSIILLIRQGGWTGQR